MEYETKRKAIESMGNMIPLEDGTLRVARVEYHAVFDGPSKKCKWL